MQPWVSVSCNHYYTNHLGRNDQHSEALPSRSHYAFITICLGALSIVLHPHVWAEISRT